MTETEKQRMAEATKQAQLTFEVLGIGPALTEGHDFDEETKNELEAKMVGGPLAMMDALFAIRDGEPWRGMTDPKEIATKILREVGIGD